MVVEADPRVLDLKPTLDTFLEGGDAIHMHKQPNFVIVLGDVSNPGAVHYRARRNVSEYVKDAGGPQFSADKGRTYVVYLDGLAPPVNDSVWGGSNVAVQPGTSETVPQTHPPVFKIELVA